jgi:hypothetical protein
VSQDLCADLTGIYLFGSAALADYHPPRSDLDVAVVAERPLAVEEKERLAADLDHRNLPCPARKLELVVYERGRLARGDVSFELDLNTGPGLQRWRTDAADSPSHWYVIDVSIGRAHGRALAGPPADAVFPEQEDRRIREAIRESLDWHVRHAATGDDSESATPADLVLNACRGWRFLEERQWSSKGEAGRWAAGRSGSPAPGQAIDFREGRGPPPHLAVAREFAEQVLALVVGSLAREESQP